MVRASDQVCSCCKGLGLVSTPVLYSMPARSIQWVPCASCRPKAAEGELRDAGAAPEPQAAQSRLG